MVVKHSDAPIFILGILPRSGTNFLFNLLRLHPDCEVPEPIWEDWVLSQSHLLVEYARSMYELWASAANWRIHESLENELCQHLGQSVVAFLESRIGGKRLLTKTPSVINLPYFFRLFPQAYLLILVRDGRDIAESSARSLGEDRAARFFGEDRDELAGKWTKKWAREAQTILEFDRVSREQERKYLIVRYEDIFLDLENELTRILRFLDLELEAYDFEEARSLPVSGSSTFRGGKKHVHWEPVEKTQAFNPLRRWSGWSRRQHERFNWIAGDLLAEFGYEAKQYSNRRQLWRIYNILIDSRIYNSLIDFAASIRFSSARHAKAVFEGYKTGDLARVRRHILLGVILNPSLLANRGVWSIFLQSVVGKKKLSSE